MLVLPTEIQIKIFGYLDLGSIQKYRLLCKRLHSLSRSPVSHAEFLQMNYGLLFCVFYGYHLHRSLFTDRVLSILLQKGAILHRFVIQLIVSDFHASHVETSLYVYSINKGYDLYGSEVNFKANDHRVFEQALRSSALDSEQSLEQLQHLIRDVGFVPVPELCLRPYSENMYQLCQLDLSLVGHLIKQGMSVDKFNDHIIDRLLAHPYLNMSHLERYLDIGFTLSDMSIKRSLAQGKQSVLLILKRLIDKQRLHKLAHDTVFDLFGPYKTSSSLNIAWNGHSVDQLIKDFQIDKQFIRLCVMTHPDSVCTPTESHAEFPVTRPYLKTRPYPLWEWVLKQYGPHDPLSVACMDDALSRAVADQELHDLHRVFIDQGFVFQPRHIKILACRVLHRNMTENAVFLLGAMREQVLERYFRPIVNQVEPMEKMPFEDAIAFRHALNQEVLDNEEWYTRMTTIQFQGQGEGGSIRLGRPSEHGIKFHQICKKFDQELKMGLVPKEEERTSDDSTHSRTSVSLSWTKRIKLWWKNRALPWRF
ncbi:hypothetical protein EDD86DRAFT_215350, partial [Gorgonomyces haynaldii]